MERVDPTTGTVVLTGATTGIGRATALRLAPRAAALVLHGLEPVAPDLLAEVRAAQPPGAGLGYLGADFGSLDAVRRLADGIRAAAARIDLLIDNASRPGPGRRTESADGFEVTFQTNYLATVLLTDALRDRLGRVLVISSATHHSSTLDLDDLQFARRGYSPVAAYARSKLAEVTYAGWLARQGVDAASMHPGVIATRLLAGMFAVEGDPPDHAAGNVVHVAGLDDVRGAYFDERRRVAPHPSATDPDVQDRLRELTLSLLA